MIKRLFDILFSFVGLLIISPILILISLFIIIDSKGGIFFKQIRVGKGNKDFRMYKFRTMKTDSEKKGFLTIGNKDSRVTRVGYYLRKYKLDEFPQLLNVIKGDMSIVGPRPEVRKYVNMYNEEQLKVLSVRPGLTDFASLEYINESELLSKSSTPEETYINEIMPAKLNINLIYIKKKSLLTDCFIIFKTILRIFFQK